MIDELISLGTTVQVWLGSGYVAYCTAYAGFQRHHKTRDTVFITAVFVAVASGAFSLGSTINAWCAYSAAVFVPLAAAICWRLLGKSSWLWLMQFLRVHREDGNDCTWESIVQTTRYVDQLSVHTIDGRILYLNDRRQFVDKAEWNGLYLGGDGSVVMAVEEEELPDGSTEQRQGVLSDWGTRLTYIPANQISRVNIRLG